MAYGGSSFDPFILPNVPIANGPDNQGTYGLSIRSQSIDTSIKNLIMITAGQSNVCNVVPSAYTPTNPTKIDQLNIYDGGVYSGSDPLVGCSIDSGGGNFATRLADSLITAGLFDRVVIVPTGINGTLVAEWQTTYYKRLIVALRRLSAKGFTPQTNVTTIILWGQGENDTLAGTGQSAYTTSLNSVITSTRTEGFSGPWFVAKQSYINGSTSSNVTNAQAAVVNHGATIWAGPNADALVGNACGVGANLACRQVAGDVHWSDDGSYSYAAAWKTALHAYGAPF